MTEGDHYVLDASVATKWFLNDEQYASQALTLLRQFQQGRVGLMAPSHIRYEVPSAILNATRQPVSKGSPRHRVDASTAYDLIDSFVGLPLLLVDRADEPDLIRLAYRTARVARCSLYDAAYIALSHVTGLPLIHAESKFRGLPIRLLPQQIWIGDYAPP